MNLSTNHLSEENLDDLLLGASGPAEEAHLASCPACSARLAEFRSTVGIFNQASATWSEARSNTISRELVYSSVAPDTAAVWSLASAAVLAFAVSLAVHRDSPPTATSGNPESALQEEIASDNELLGAIDSEIARSTPSPAEVYSIPQHSSNARVASLREVRD